MKGYTLRDKKINRIKSFNLIERGKEEYGRNERVETG